jgi:hypothetical protein
MSMIKYVAPSGWDWDRPVAVPVPISSRGLIGHDRREFTKIAGHMFIDEIDRTKFANDEIPVHLIALGASEAYGPNRNGDGFKEATCKQYHDTFVKFARFFRNHKNKPDRGDPSFGVVKSSAYNDSMRRVELLVGLNADKSAADRNDGFVADAEIEKIAKGDDLAVSMACRVPHDTCSWCGNNAKTRSEYCGSEKCAAGGCKDNLTRLVKMGDDMHHLHVDNPTPTWFDISRVFRPADRIAYGAKADWLTKAAADNGLFAFQDYVKMAESDSAPLRVIMHQEGLPGEWDQAVASQVKVAYGLAQLERQRGTTSDEIYSGIQTAPMDLDTLGELGTTKCAEGLSALADNKIIISFPDWARLARKSELLKAAALYLPSIYNRILDNGNIEQQVELNPYPLSEKVASIKQRTFANLSVSSHSLEKSAVQNRSMLSAIRSQPTPVVNSTNMKLGSTNNNKAEELAVGYALYKIAALHKIAAFDGDFLLTAMLSVRQNQLS